jgi:ribosomal protein S18 acetylase RimI-like enzyme
MMKRGDPHASAAPFGFTPHIACTNRKQPAMESLPHSWETERLRFDASVPAETDRLCAIFNACCESVAPWDDSFSPVAAPEMRELIDNGIAGPGETGSIFAIRTIRFRNSDRIAGYVHCHLGMPKPDVVFISMMVIDPAYQREHIGTEATRSLLEQLQRLGRYNAVWARVALKNWPALRHWMNAGFRTILEWRGDTVHSETAHAGVILERKLA